VALLRSLGCDEVQGFLWSPPVPPAQCERLLVQGVLPPRCRRAGRAVARGPRGKSRAGADRPAQGCGGAPSSSQAEPSA
jgi:hypothetical protein